MWGWLDVTVVLTSLWEVRIPRVGILGAEYKLEILIFSAGIEAISQAGKDIKLTCRG